MFHSIFNIGQNVEIQCLHETFYRRTCLEYLESPRSEKKTEHKK